MNSQMPAQPVTTLGQQTSSPTEGTLLPLLYAMDQDHGWAQGMRAITHTLLEKGLSAQGAILELGCGAGTFLQEMAERHPAQTCIGLDRNGVALTYANRHAANIQLSQADLHQLPFPDNQFGLIVALDVFDQRFVQLAGALQESWRILQPGGSLLLRISAHPWLHSTHDDAFNTGRRYQRQEVVHAINASAFELDRVTFANMLLSPPVILQRLAERWRLLPFSSTHDISPIVNRLVAQALYTEARLLSHTNLPFGISLYVLARKRL